MASAEGPGLSGEAAGGVAVVAVVPGEGAAPEAVDATLRVLERLDGACEFTFPPVGEPAVRAFGSVFPDEARRMIDEADATLFGATSGPSGFALFHLRFGHQTYANVRPARWMPGARSPLARPDGVDLVIVRENLEGLYVGIEGSLSDLSPLRYHHPLGGLVHDRAGRYSLKVVTEDGCRRIARFAGATARRRSAAGHRGLVTIGAKHNILSSDGLFVDICREVLTEAGVEHEENYVDNLARRLVAEPHDLDVVLVPNLYGDILSDLAAGVIGGLGLMPSGCYGDGPAYFEPPHGTAPDLAGRGIINPTAQLLSAAMMLEHLGRAGNAARLRAAVDAVYARGDVLTPDQGGTATTEAFASAVIDQL